ncbi:MAG: ATP-dependent Clp protease ATP-binding subunit ClpX [Holosporales bacterium]
MLTNLNKIHLYLEGKMMVFIILFLSLFPACGANMTDSYDTFIDAVRPFDYPQTVLEGKLSKHAKKFAMYSVMLATQHALRDDKLQKGKLLEQIKKNFSNSFIHAVVQNYYSLIKKGERPIDQSSDSIDSMIKSSESLTTLDEGPSTPFSIVAQAVSVFKFIEMPKKASPSLPVNAVAPDVIGLSFFEPRCHAVIWQNPIYVREALLETWRLRVNDLEKHLKENLVGQDQAIEDFVLGIFNHYAKNIKKRYVAFLKTIGEDALLERITDPHFPSCLLLAGPSGTGKTEMVQLACQFLKYPIGRGSGANLSPAGYKGDDPSDVLIQLIEDAKKYARSQQAKKVAEQDGIVFLDEIDKLAVDSGEERFREGTQNAILTFIEGSQPTRIGEDDYFSTKNVLVILAGAFSRMISPLAGGESSEVTHNDLIAYGLRPELVNRIHSIIQTAPLTKDSIFSIICHPKNSPLHRLMKEHNEFYKTNIKVNKDALELFSKEIEKEGVGARNLYGKLEKIIRFTLKSKQQYGAFLQAIIQIEEHVLKTLNDENAQNEFKKLKMRRQEKFNLLNGMIEGLPNFALIQRQQNLFENPFCDKEHTARLLQEDLDFFKKEKEVLGFNQRQILINAETIKGYFKMLRKIKEDEGFKYGYM